MAAPTYMPAIMERTRWLRRERRCAVNLAAACSPRAWIVSAYTLSPQGGSLETNARSGAGQVIHQGFQGVRELLAGDVVHQVGGDNRFRTGLSFYANVGRVHNFAVALPGAAALQADGGNLVHAATGRAAGP